MSTIIGYILITVAAIIIIFLLKDLLGCLALILIILLLLSTGLGLIQQSKINNEIAKNLLHENYNMYFKNSMIATIEFNDNKHFTVRDDNQNKITGKYKIKTGFSSENTSLFLTADKDIDTSWFLDDEQNEFFQYYKNKLMFNFYSLEFADEETLHILGSPFSDTIDMVWKKVY